MTNARANQLWHPANSSGSATRIYIGDLAKLTKTVGDPPTVVYEFENGQYKTGGAEAGAFDNFNGTTGNDAFYGFAGNDAMAGLQGDDLIEGGDGDDLLLGGSGADTINGGAGVDVIFGSGEGRLTPPVDKDVLEGGDGKYQIHDDIRLVRFTNTNGINEGVFACAA